MSEFWLKKPAILFSDGCNFNPFSNGTLNEKLNTYTRFTIITVLVLYCLTQESKYLIGGLIVITLIVLYYLMYKKDNYENTHFDNLLKESGFSEEDCFEILPDNINTFVDQVLETKTPIQFIEVNVGAKIISYNIIPIWLILFR